MCCMVQIKVKEYVHFKKAKKGTLGLNLFFHFMFGKDFLFIILHLKHDLTNSLINSLSSFRVSCHCMRRAFHTIEVITT